MAAFVYLAFAGLSFLVYRVARHVRLPPVPPGPPNYFFIGNMLQYPKSRPWQAFWQWSKEYNTEIVHLNLAGSHLLVLNTYEAAYELFEKRGSIYSTRPPLPMVKDLMGWGDSLPFLPYGNVWRDNRKLIHQGFNEQASQEYRPLLVKASHSLVTRLLRKPERFSEHLRFMVTQVSLPAIYGLEIEHAEHPYMVQSQAMMDALNANFSPHKYLVNIFPWMKYIPSWVPGAQFQRDAKRWRDEKASTMEMMITSAEEDMHSGIAKPSLVSHNLAPLQPDTEAYKATRSLVGGLAGIALTASMDTTGAALETFVLAMVLHPQAQAKAHAELDAVLGHGQLPTFEDQVLLPYLSAVVKESSRWHSVGPMGVPHYIEVEDVYNGYRIPANSILLGNLWGILHDEKEYPEPLAFKPERFIKDGVINKDVRDPFSCAFGLGRRICPGRFHATDNVWIAAATILALFEIIPELDESGEPILPPYDFEPTFIAPPKAFKCQFKPRSKKVEAIIEGLEDNLAPL